MPPSDNAIIKRRKGSSHDRTGCLTCRQRHKKCLENTFPTCGACSRLNLECVREPKRNIVQERRNTRKQRLGPRENLPPGLVAPDLPLFHHPEYTGKEIERSKRRHIMAYYVDILTGLLTTSVQNNSFLSAFLPMAMESSVLQEALIAWASGHMSTADPSYKVTALEARSRALSALAKSVSQKEHDTSSLETNAAACLALLTSDVCLGNQHDWYHHLLGAKHLIMSAQSGNDADDGALRGPAVFKMSPEGRWILRNFAYHDIIGSATLGTEPLMKGDYLAGVVVGIDTYLGVSSGILTYISQINCLQCPIATLDSWSDFHRKCLRIEQQLHSWQYDANTSSVLSAVAETYRSASLIHLYRRTRRVLSQVSCTFEFQETQMLQRDALQAKMQYHVSNTIRQMAKVPVHDYPETALLFPLFFAGGEVADASQADAIRQRLHLMLQKRQFENIKQALNVLEEVWYERFSRPGDPVDNYTWEDVLRQKSGKLLLC